MCLLLFVSLLKNLFVDLVKMPYLLLLDVDSALKNALDKFGEDVPAKLVHNLLYLATKSVILILIQLIVILIIFNDIIHQCRIKQLSYYKIISCSWKGKASWTAHCPQTTHSLLFLTISVCFRRLTCCLQNIYSMQSEQHILSSSFCNPKINWLLLCF